MSYVLAFSLLCICAHQVFVVIVPLNGTDVKSRKGWEYGKSTYINIRTLKRKLHIYTVFLDLKAAEGQASCVIYIENQL